MKILSRDTIISYLASVLPEAPMIIEAGAFDGSDTYRLITTFPQATVYAFEPLPHRFIQLQKRMEPYPSVHCIQKALSDYIGTQTLYVAEHPDRPQKQGQASSLRPPHKRIKYSPITFPYTIEVNTTTLDAFVREQNLFHIDLLWLDTQGHELSILKAGYDILSRVQLIYLEVGFKENYQGQPLYPEVLQWLNNHGFTEIARDFEKPNDTLFGNIIVKQQSR